MPLLRRKARPGLDPALETVDFWARRRRLHLNVDGTTPAVEQVRTALSAWTGQPPRVAMALDPARAAVAHLRG